MARLGALLVHRRSYVAPAAFGFGVGGLGLVGRGLCWRVWGWWVERVSGGMCFWVWGWWVGVGWSGFVLQGLGLVGWGWSVVSSAFRFGRGGSVGRGRRILATFSSCYYCRWLLATDYVLFYLIEYRSGTSPKPGSNVLFPSALPLASAGVGGYIFYTYRCIETGRIH